jgi:hypothetical protein
MTSLLFAETSLSKQKERRVNGTGHNNAEVGTRRPLVWEPRPADADQSIGSKVRFGCFIFGLLRPIISA